MTMVFDALFCVHQRNLSMKDDPIVEEIRKYRQEHANLYNNDLDKIYLAIKEKEKKYEHKLINRQDEIELQNRQ